jgi:DNA primase
MTAAVTHRQSGSHFARAHLPAPADYYQRAGLRLIGRGAWRSALCPFHDDHRPSLRVNVESGGFRCMVCGARGGDVIDFHRRRHGVSFSTAAKALGAWS